MSVATDRNKVAMKKINARDKAQANGMKQPVAKNLRSTLQKAGLKPGRPG